MGVQELKKKGPLNAMNVFSGTSSDKPEPHEKSGNESRWVHHISKFCTNFG